MRRNIFVLMVLCILTINFGLIKNVQAITLEVQAESCYLYGNAVSIYSKEAKSDVVKNINQYSGIKFILKSATDASCNLKIYYSNGSSTVRGARIILNGNLAKTPSFPITGGFNIFKTSDVNLKLKSGNNSIEISGGSKYSKLAPRIDKIVIKSESNISRYKENINNGKSSSNSTKVPVPNTTRVPSQNTTKAPAPNITKAPIQNTTSNQPPKTETPDNALSFEKKVIELCNIERAKVGLPPLSEDSKLMEVARMKSQDMVDKNYFSHTSPTFGDPFNMLKNSGVKYLTAGENIADGQQTPEEVVNSWMNSPGHKANILNKDYTKIGVGIARDKNGRPKWTQLFTKPIQ